MYPYFSKITGEQKLYAAQNSTEAGDRLRGFLEKNPAYGNLVFQVTGGQGAFPVAGAKIVIIKDLDDTHAFSITEHTDESGKTAGMYLPAPSRNLSQTPGNGDVFAKYRAEITAAGYTPVQVLEIPVFDGITTIQPVNMLPNIGGNQPTQMQTIDDKEPNL